MEVSLSIFSAPCVSAIDSTHARKVAPNVEFAAMRIGVSEDTYGYPGARRGIIDLLMKPPSLMTADPASPQELKALLDAAVDGIILINHVGLIQVFNRSAERLFGYESAEVLGRNVSMLMTENDQCAHDRYLARYAATRVPHIIGKGREIDARRKDGSVFPALLSVGVVAGTEPPRFVGFVHDITARRQSEEDGLRLQERLMHVSRLATIGEMASGIAHELNQPLAAIATYAHACDRLLALPEPDIEEIQTALREIAEQAVRAGDIIRRLRSLTRAESTQHGPADVNDVIAELTDLIQSDAKAHGVAFRADLAPNLPQITLDRAQIQQVVLNLVRNALEALALAQLDTREVVVRTRLTPEGEVEIAVCDTGPGVDSRIVDHMFDPFCTTKAAGTGLGLAISRTIVSAHGGSLEYLPHVAAGACFAIRLPLDAQGGP
jgi:two-component system, LuxR family, sensor kinase FixL